MRLCRHLLEMEPKVLTTKEEDQEKHRQDCESNLNICCVVGNALVFFYHLCVLFVILISSSSVSDFQLLNSPWDVSFEPVNEVVYIAMAGQHQIWKHNTLEGTTKAFSGDGYERNLNGTR